MAISVRCPGCDHRFAVPDKFAGKKGRCPKCKTVFQAVAADEEPQEIPAEEIAPADEPPGGGRPSVKPRTPRPSLGGAEEAPAPAEPVAAAASPTPMIHAKKRRKKPGGKPAGAARAISDSDMGMEGDSSSGRGGARRGGQPKMNNLLYVYIGIGVLAALILASAGAYMVLGKKGGKDGKQSETATQGTQEQSGGDTTSGDGTSTGTTPQESAAVLPGKWNDLKPSVVKLTARSGDDKQVGLGVVVDAAKGLIVTDLSLIEGAETVDIQASDGAPFSAAGTVAVDRKHALAILAFRSPPNNLKAVKVAPPNQLKTDSAVFLVAPEWTLESAQVEKIMTGSDISPSMGPTIEDRGIADDQSIQWIRHKGMLSQEKRGSPLFNEAGELVGVNVPLMGSPAGYAVDATHVAEALKSASAEPKPFGSTGEEATDSSESTPPDEMEEDSTTESPSEDSTTETEEETTEPGEETTETDEEPFAMPGESNEEETETPDTEEEPAEDDHPVEPDADHHPQLPEGVNPSIEKLQEAYEACEKMKWNPQSADDYAKIAEYADQAWGAFEDGVPEETTAAAKESLDKLCKNPLVWDDDHINAIDKLAAEALSKEGASGGCFFYGRFLATGPPIPDFPGVQPVVMRLSKTEQHVLLLVAKNVDQFDREKRYLVAGRILPSRGRIHLGDKDIDVVFVQANFAIADPQK